MQKKNWHQLWVNMHLATMDGDAENPLGIIMNGALATDHDGHITFVGARAELPDDLSQIADFSYEMDGGWMLPGLIDCHAYLVHGGSRADMFIQKSHGGDIDPKATFLKTVTDTHNADTETLLAKSRQRLLTQLHDGVTCFEIKSGYGLDLENSTKILRIATDLRDEYDIHLTRTFAAAPYLPDAYEHLEAYLEDLCTNMIPQLAKDDLIDQVAFHTHMFSTEQQTRICASAGALNLRVQQCHDDIVSTDQAVILAPATPYTQQSCTAKSTAAYLAKKMPLALATGYNPETAPILSLLHVMNLACTMYGTSVEEALQGVTINAAKALGIENATGSLTVGKEAHFAIFAIESPADLAYYIGARPCQGIALKGQYIRFV